MQKYTTSDFENNVIAEGETTLVIFSRKTCSVCHAVLNMFETIEKDYKGKDIVFANIDSEEEKGLFAKLALKGVPQALFYKDGLLVKKLSGQHEEDEYYDTIDEVLAM